MNNIWETVAIYLISLIFIKIQIDRVTFLTISMKIKCVISSLKVGLLPSEKFFLIFFNDIPSKMMKNVFISS